MSAKADAGRVADLARAVVADHDPKKVPILLMEEDVDFTICADDSGSWHYFMDDGSPGDRVDMYLTVHNFVDWS